MKLLKLNGVNMIVYIVGHY